MGCRVQFIAMNQPLTPKFTPEEFDQLVVEALETLPLFFQEKLSNIEVMTADWPSKAELQSVGLQDRNQLLGLYRGIPLTRRTSGYNLVLPDKITLFRMPIQRFCRTPQAVMKQTRRTVLHELAHHFGISDERLRELGAY